MHDQEHLFSKNIAQALFKICPRNQMEGGTGQDWIGEFNHLKLTIFFDFGLNSV